MKHKAFLAVLLALLLCFSGCSKPEMASSGEAAQSLPDDAVPGESAPAPLAYDLQRLPSEPFEGAFNADGFEDMLGGMGETPLLEWADKDHLVFCAGRFPVPLLGPGDLRVFSYDLMAQETTLLAERSDPNCDLSVNGFFTQAGTPYVAFRQGRHAMALRLDLAAGTSQPLDSMDGSVSRIGTAIRENLDTEDLMVCSVLEPEKALAWLHIQRQPGESFVELSPDGGSLAFQVMGEPKFVIYGEDEGLQAEIESSYYSWGWCETPGYLFYAKESTYPQEERYLVNLREKSETLLPIDPDCTPLLIEPEFSILRFGALDPETEVYRESIQLLDNRTGTLLPLDIEPREGAQSRGQLIAYDPETSTAAILCMTTSADYQERWVDAYLLKLDF